MTHRQGQTWGIDWRALFSWMLITAAFLFASLTSVVFLR